MKTVETDTIDELRPEYKRSDFGKLVRGKYANRMAEETNVILLEPDIAKGFHNYKIDDGQMDKMKSQQANLTKNDKYVIYASLLVTFIASTIMNIFISAFITAPITDFVRKHKASPVEEILKNILSYQYNQEREFVLSTQIQINSLPIVTQTNDLQSLNSLVEQLNVSIQKLSTTPISPETEPLGNSMYDNIIRGPLDTTKQLMEEMK